jgi:hypothetical protein
MHMTVNSHLKYRFNLHADYLWSINDYLAYGEFVDCCVHGRLNCPICMNDSDAFILQHGGKVTFLLSSKIPSLESRVQG